jgi:hypothetical protein
VKMEVVRAVVRRGGGLGTFYRYGGGKPCSQGGETTTTVGGFH